MLSDDLAKRFWKSRRKNDWMARRLVESVVYPASLTAAVTEGIKRHWRCRLRAGERVNGEWVSGCTWM